MTVRICIALSILAFAGPVRAAAPDHPALIPLPSSVTWQTGGVTVTPEWRVEAKGKAATGVVDYARRTFGLSANGKSGQLKLALVPAAAIGIGAMTAAMLRLPMSAVLLTTLFLGSDGLPVMPLTIVAVVVAYVTAVWLTRPQPASSSTPPARHETRQARATDAPA